MVPPLSQNTVGDCKQNTFLILHCIRSRLVTLLKGTDAPTLVPYTFDLIVSLKFLNFSFQMFLLFVPEMSDSLTSYVV
jgi:hypothetical protein